MKKNKNGKGQSALTFCAGILGLGLAAAGTILLCFQLWQVILFWLADLPLQSLGQYHWKTLLEILSAASIKEHTLQTLFYYLCLPGLLCVLTGVLILALLLLAGRHVTRQAVKKSRERLLEQLLHPEAGVDVENAPVADLFESRQAEHEKQLQALKEDMLANRIRQEDAIHQLKSTLNAAMLAKDLLAIAPDAQAANTLEASLEKAVDFCDAFLRASQLSFEVGSFHFSSTNLSQLLLEAARETGTSTCAEEETPVYVLADAFWLKEALLTLLESAQTLTLSVSSQSRQAKIHIQTGWLAEQGLDVQQAFVRYATSRQSQGHYGIGLAMAKHIIEKHHGSIQAHMEGTQAVFMVCLPLYEGSLPNVIHL